MKNKEVLDQLGYCGINCGKCFAFHTGPIKENSIKLNESLGNFDIYAERFSELLDEPVFKQYKQFKELLNHFASGNCRGCRLDGCMIFKSCKVRSCALEHKVHFCWQCNDFPCKNTGFDEHLQKRWIAINNQMKEIGVKAYFEKIKDIPRY